LDEMIFEEKGQLLDGLCPEVAEEKERMRDEG
jgi:hypothetical protein